MIVGYVLFLGLVGLAGWGFIEAVQAEPAVVGSIGVAVAGALGVVWQQRQAEKARLREAHRDRMSPVYYNLLGVMFKKIAGGDASGPDSEAEEFFRDLKARQDGPNASLGSQRGKEWSALHAAARGCRSLISTW
jgi:hypothetical protein